MLSSMSPVGERTRRQPWWLTVTAYVLGSAVGGAAVGGALGAGGAVALAALSGEVRLAGLGVLAAVGLAVDLAHRVTLPSWHRQVDEQWLDTYRGWVYGAGYGLQLGAGIVTIVPASITYVTLGAALLSADPRAGAAIGGTFGLVRALPLLVTRTIRTPSALRDLLRRVSQRSRPVTVTARTAQVVVALLAGAAATGVVP